jgi:uncharacterized protein (TIRG00374 family)
MKKKTAISLLISAIFLYIALKGISFDELAAALGECDYLYVIPAMIVMCLLYVIRAIRWHYLVKPIKKARFKNLFSATMIGFMANNIFPVRIGEFVRADILGEDEKISKSSVFATIVIERLFDGMTILLILLVTFFSIDMSSMLSASDTQLVKWGAYGALGFYLLVILFIILLNYKYEKTKKFILAFLKPFPDSFSDYADKIIDSFRAGLKIEKDIKNIALIIFYSLLHWIFCAFPIYIILIGFGYNLPIETAYVVLIMIAFAIMLPAAPGYIGTLNAAVKYALMLYGLSGTQGFSVSLVVHMINFFPPVVLGFLMLWLKDISIKSIEKTKAMEQTKGDLQ